MREPVKHTIVVALLLILTLFPAWAAAAGMVLLSEENPPFNFTEDGELTGGATQVVQEIARRLGISDSIEVLPWARAYKRLMTEPNVVLFTTAMTREREAMFHWVGPLYRTRVGFYGLKSRGIRIDSIEAAKQVRAIATYKDDYREQMLVSLGFTNLDSSKNSLSNIRKLVSGRVDLWFYDNVGAPMVARQAGIDPDEIEEVFTHHENVSYIAISKQTAPDIVQQWQAALDEMKTDGTFWWLTRRWLPAEAIMAAESRAGTIAPLALKLYTENSPPSSFLQGGRPRGLSVEIVQEILRRIGQPDTISVVPWARGYQLALSEADTALFSTTRLTQRESLFEWVGPLYHQHWGFYRWKGTAVDIPTMAAAKKVGRIGTYHQDAKMQYLQVQGFDNLVPTNKNVTNLMHLKRGSIDLWVSSDFNMPHLARQAGLSPEQLELAYTFNSVGNYIAFSKNTSAHVIRLWQAVLDEIKSDGTYERICQKYEYRPH